MNTHKLFILAMAATAIFFGCSEDTHTNSWQDENGDAEFSEESFKQKDSLTTRLDIDYQDTLDLGDTNVIHMEIATPDTSIKDKDTTIQMLCSDGVLCIDTAAKAISLFLGEFPVGTRISVSAETMDLSNDTIQLVSEFGDTLATVNAVQDSESGESVFGNYMLPGHDDMVKNQFVIFKEGFYYMEMKADFDSTSHLHILVDVDTAYYDYIGDTTEVTIGLQDTLRGIVIIGDSPSKIKIGFSSTTGYSIDFVASGNWINEFAFYEEDSLLAKTDTTIDQLLLPEDSTAWTLQVKPLNIKNYLTGPYATFETITNSRELGQGEYLAFPDSVAKPGDMLEIVRERNSQAKYYLRQEQYVWLADMKKGDSIEIHHEMIGYFGGTNNKSTTIINKKGEVQGTISSLSPMFTAKEDGPVYLHYLSTCPYLSNNNADETLQFNTRVSYYGSLTSFYFYDKTDQEVKDTTYIFAGDTLALSDFLFRTLPSTASSSMKWYTPCEDIVSHESENNYMTTPVFNIQNIECRDNSGNEKLEGEQEVSTLKLIAQENAQGESFRLIAESLADPLQRDTLTIIVQ